MTTESVLRDWRYGPVQAERLAAALLHVEGYEDVDPQHPLGGRDGLKDVLCKRRGRLFVAAAYFPPTAPSTAALTKKFNDDFAGVARNNADGFCFFVNQRLSVTRRAKLISSTGAAQVEIYHLERMRALLDSARGCGVRLEYLQIAMSEAEQFAFWDSSNSRLGERIRRLELLQQQTYEAVLASADSVVSRTHLRFDELQQQISSSLQPGRLIDLAAGGSPTANLDIDLVCWLHRLVMSQQGAAGVSVLTGGILRTANLWIGADYEDAPRFTPPGPEEVPDLLARWALAWREGHNDLRNEPDRNRIVASLAEFYYEFLRVHPFTDGNGRVADVLLDQAARELLQRSILERLSGNRPDHYRALAAANTGDLAPLRARIAAVLS